MQTQLKWRSLCAPLDIVPLLPLFFLYFWAVVVFLGFFDFFFLFFDIFLHLGAQKSNHKKYELKLVKGVACGKFRRRAQN